MTVDRNKLASLFGEVNRAADTLSRYRELSNEQLLENAERLGNIKYLFIVAIEGCIDICNHLAARGFQKTPESYAQCFQLLKEGKVVDADLAGRMARLARFRNLLVHLYWKVDDEKVVEVLRTEPEILKSFVAAVARFVSA
jgi:uncharacterized protein YutE (UPF0331/DUF86 family)